MKTLFSAAFAAVLLPCLLAAPLAAAEGQCQVRAVVAKGGGLPDEAYVHDAAGTATAGAIRLKDYLNHEYDKLAPKGGPVVITTKAEPGSAKLPEEVIGECELPAKAESLILFFQPKARGKKECTVTVVDASAKAFPPGSFKVMNLTSLPVRLELEEEKFEFKPGETKVIAKAPIGATGSSAMKLFRERDGKWEEVASGPWAALGKKRSLQAISENPATKRFEVSGIRDLVAP